MSEGRVRGWRLGQVRATLIGRLGGAWALCGWCLEPIDLTLPARSSCRRGAVVDHMVAVSRGGSNDFENLRLLHAQCNRERSDSPHVTRAAWLAARPTRRPRPRPPIRYTRDW
jgi:5-methylcytosine-specific restriction endonuclease McrA